MERSGRVLMSAIPVFATMVKSQVLLISALQHQQPQVQQPRVQQPHVQQQPTQLCMQPATILCLSIWMECLLPRVLTGGLLPPSPCQHKPKSLELPVRILGWLME